MANTSVLTGADGSITLSTSEGAEGDLAQGVIDTYDLLTVGRVQNVAVSVRSDVKPFHEVGQRYPTELRYGNIHIAGTIGRAYINGALLRLLLGEGADSRPAASWNQPSFNITVLLDNPALAAVNNALTLYGVKIDGWSYGVPEDDFVLEQVSFQAMNLSVTDEG